MINTCDVFAWDLPVGKLLRKADSSILFRYASHVPFELSPIHMPFEPNRVYKFDDIGHLENLPGLFADALPGKFGQTLLEKWKEQTREDMPNPIERLLILGNHGTGALRFEPKTKETNAHLETLTSIADYRESARRILTGEEYDTERMRHFVIEHASIEGARPKALIDYNPTTRECALPGQAENTIPAIVKFDNDDATRRLTRELRLEYVYHLQAKAAGITMPNLHLIDNGDRASLVIERFDTEDGGYHVHTLANLWHHNYESLNLLDYERFLRTTLPLGCPEERDEIFRRMVFNHLYANHDDHPKNHAFLMDRQGHWRLSAAYDLTFTATERSDQKLTINGKKSRDVGMADFLELANRTGVKKPKQLIEQVVASLGSLPGNLVRHLHDGHLDGLVLEMVRLPDGSRPYLGQNARSWDGVKMPPEIYKE